MTGHEHPLPDSLLIPAVLHQRGMPLPDVNEGDMKGLTEKKPGGKRVIHAHSYSLVRSCCILTNIRTHIYICVCAILQTYKRKCTCTPEEWRIY